MPIKTFTPEQIVGKLRQIEVLVSQSKTVRLPRRTPKTGHRWTPEKRPTRLLVQDID